MVGLLVTQVIAYLGGQAGSVGATVAFAVTGGLAAVFVLCWKFAKAGRGWAFLVGGIFYAMDGLLVLVVREWVSLFFHVFVLFWVVRGFTANLKLRGMPQGSLVAAS